MEEWKIIPECIRYEVSNTGKVRSNVSKTPRLLKPMKTAGQRNYHKYGLKRDDGKVWYALGHRLVAICFLDNPENHPVVHHKDNNPENNHVDNLEWCTYSQNTKYAIEDGSFNQVWGKTDKPTNTKFSDIHIKAIRDLLSVGWSITQVCKVFEVSRGYVSEIKNYKKRK